MSFFVGMNSLSEEGKIVSKVQCTRIILCDLFGRFLQICIDFEQSFSDFDLLFI